MEDVGSGAAQRPDEPEMTVRPVTRSQNWAHVATDDAYVIFLGRDFEIIAIRHDIVPVETHVQASEAVSTQEVLFDPRLEEVARLRVSPGTLKQLLGTGLRQLVEAGASTPERTLKIVEEIVSEAGLSRLVGQEVSHD